MNEDDKASEGKAVIIIPILITIVCAFFDWWFGRIAGDYADKKTYEYINCICRLIIGYFFPSIISLTITMLVQHTVFNNELSGLKNKKTSIFWAVVLTVLYGVTFITCLSEYNTYTAISFLIFSCVYVYIFNKFYLDDSIRFEMGGKSNKKYKNKPNA